MTTEPKTNFKTQQKLKAQTHNNNKNT